MVSLKLPDHAVTRRLRDWKSLLRTARPVKNTAVLERRHIYILPTRQGLLFALVLACMLIGSINYALSLGFVLTFLLAGLGVIAMLHTWRNLVRLTLAPGKAPPVFAGDAAHFGFTLGRTDHHPRYAIGLRQGDGPAVFADIPVGNDGSDVVLSLASHHRGWLDTGKLTVFTEFPLGLFHAWSYVAPESRCLIYPRPAPPGLPLPVSDTGERAGRTASAGDDDFSGLRPYQHGDALRRIDWKASARSQSLLTKQFQGASSAALWLDWYATPGDTETRISQLARWVLDAHATGQRYGLRMPGLEIAPAAGESQFHRCLETLALFGAFA